MDQYNIKIKKLILDDFRAFGHFEMDFDEYLTVLIGNNGAGKTTLLDATAALLRVFLQYSFYKKDNFKLEFSRKDVKNGSETSLCYLIFDIKYPKRTEQHADSLWDEEEDTEQLWEEEHKIGFSINRRSGRIEYLGLDDTRLDDFNDFIRSYREGESLPVLAYYGCNALNIELPNQSNRERYISLVKSKK
jgi:predicted ATP-binding protein involved in virulence